MMESAPSSILRGPLLAASVLLAVLVGPDLAQAQKRPLDHDAYDRWKTIGGERLSPDGSWALYRLEPRVGDGELVVTTRDGREHRFPRVDDARFTPDSRFVVFTIVPAYDSVRTLKLADTPRDELPADTLGILELATGTVERVAGVRSWRLSGRAGSTLAYQLEARDEAEPEASAAPELEPEVEPEPEPEIEPEIEPEPGEPEVEPEPGAGPAESEPSEREKPDTYPLVVRVLADGEGGHRFEDVVAYAVAEEAALVAYTASSAEGSADGVYLVDAASGERTTLLTGEGSYEGLVLARDGRAAAFMTDRDDYDAEEADRAVYHWRRGLDEARRVAWTGKDGIPSGWVVSEHGDLAYSEDGSRLFFATAPRPAPEPEDSLLPEEEVVLDVWHWQDPYIQPMQAVNLREDLERSYGAVVHLDSRDRVVQLETAALPDVDVADEGNARYGLASTDVPYRRLVGVESPGFADLWIVDLRTGERRQVAGEQRVVWSQLSPDGEYAAWYDADERHWFAVETAGGAVVNLTAGIPYPIWDEQDDHPMAPYPYGIAGWTEDDDALLVYDRFDVWAVDPAGRDAPRNVTEGYGREHRTELRYVDLDRDERAIDPDAALLFEAFEVDTKEGGFFRDRVTGGEAPRQLVFGPKHYGRPTRAEDAEVLLYTREDVAEFPDLWMASTSFESPVKLSDANPQQAEYNWATVELVEWLSTDGIPLQGLLFKPEDFDPSKTYPMMVNFYERDSDNLYSHFPPLPHRSVIRPTFYASRGYIVFMPDIIYEDGYPGESALDAVMPGTLMLAAEPWVDQGNVGIQGHSWGGYQIAYMITQTDFFKAAEAGAPVANMTSAYGGIRWGSGLSRMFQYERDQSRIGGSLWEETERYLENSPLFQLDRVKTPLLIMHNDRDHAVPWYQGIELFMGLRRLDKPVWMIVYNDELHWPTSEAEKRDWNIRMQQFFDHYLKGAPAPRWMVEGIPATEKGRTLGLETEEAGAGSDLP